MVEYNSAVSGYVYDPEKDYSETEMAPSTPFKEMLKDWILPICSISKN